MAPIGSSKLDKVAWGWCSDVEPENISEDNIATAYRLNAPKCQFPKCRRNCQGNPFCLNGLGESKWMSDPVEEMDEEDLDSECRKPQSFVGLRNLGATCYINSLLQLWFHNIAFRNAILKWNPDEDPTDKSVIHHLQFLFTLMQFGKKKSVDPSDFVSSLGIDVSTQQDAREFSQLFISYLEDYLKRQSDLAVRNVVNNNFQGHYNYVTRCSNCKTESIRESTFYELEVNVKGHRTLDESIAEFLKEEKLEGADMYSCGICHSKQEATRHIELTALPPLFNIQLIRFVYDRQKGMKKKLNTPLQFPENLDMGPYLKRNNGESTPVMYNLFAVLIHKGPSANSGHYVAHICDQTSGSWYMFNDESTQKLEGKKLKLSSDEDYEVDEGAKKQKVGKAIKGYLWSSNAYMLVYTASDSGMDKTPLSEDSLQQHLKNKLLKYNETFDSMISESWEVKRSQIEDENLMKAEMVSFLNTLPVQDNSDWEALSVKWLTNWIAANRSSGFYPIDNNHFICPHSKINPESIKEFKFINKDVAHNIYEKYGGGPRLDKDSLCKECVKLLCANIRAKAQIAIDRKEVNLFLKTKENFGTPAYWVGKESLKSWKAIAINNLDKVWMGANEENKEEQMSEEGCNWESPLGMGDRSVDSPSKQSMLVQDSDTCPSLFPFPPFVDSSGPLAKIPFRAKRKRPILLLRLLDNLRDAICSSPDTILSSFSSFCNELNIHLSSIGSCNVLAFGIAANCVNNGNNHLKTDPSPSGSNSEESSTDQENQKKDQSNSQLLEKNCINYTPSSCEDPADSQSDGNPSPPKKMKLASNEEKDKDGSDDGKLNGNKSDDDEDEDYEFNFNEDIICPHGNLCVEETSRRLVPEQAWTTLKSYFPDCREFPADTEPCIDCQCLVSEGKVAKDLQKQQALKEKELLGNLYMGKNRPKYPFVGVFRVLSVPEFLEPWRKFVREPTRREPLTCLKNSSLVCSHGGLVYNPVQSEDFEKMVLVTDEEWEKLSTNFKVDVEICLEFKESGEIVPTPAVCAECLSNRIVEEQKAQLKYSKAKVYIRHVPKKSEDDNLTSVNSNLQSKKKTRSTVDVGVRRSSRNRRNKGEKVFTISSDQTLRDLKIEILNWLEVAPVDQHLTLEDGSELNNPDATLASLNVFPDSVIYLKVDEPCDVSPNEDRSCKKLKFEPEPGFKGTSLLKR